MDRLEGLDNSPVPDYRGMLDLHGRGYLVVGAGRGMGRQTAHAISAHGGRVLCMDIDQPRRQKPPRRIDGFASAITCAQILCLTDSDDIDALDRDCAIEDDVPLGIHRDHTPCGDEKIDLLSR